GGGVERLAAAVLRQGVHLAQDDVGVRVEDQVDSAGEGQAALPLPEALAGEVDGDQRGGAGGGDGQTRAAQAEQVGQAAGEEARLAAGADEGVDAGRVQRGQHLLRVVEVHQ